MSSGSLPLGSYHRAQSLGSGSYGSVVTVYNDEGDEFALKLFDEDDVGISLGALREISILRLLRHENSHPNVIAIQDVQTGFTDDEDTGAGTDGCLSIAMPLYPQGSLMTAIEQRKIHSDKTQKIQIAHGLLSAVAYLHENSIIHRDIKSDNVLLNLTEKGIYEPVLIDFSLAKIVDPSVVIQDAEKMMPPLLVEDGEETTHTPSVGTPTYRAPEVIAEDEYSFPSDLWSVGVCLLELLRGKALEVQKDKGALTLIQGCLDELPKDQPFPDLIRGLLEINPSKRLTARQALEAKVFQKFGLLVHPKTYHRLQIHRSLPLDNQETNTEEQKENSCQSVCNSVRSGKSKKKHRVDPTVVKRFQRISRVCHAMEWDNPMTVQAALTFSIQMSTLCDIDDPDDTQALLDCCVLAQKFFERHLSDLTELGSSHSIFKDWDMDNYVDNEGTLFMMMDFCLYPRQFTPV